MKSWDRMCLSIINEVSKTIPDIFVLPDICELRVLIVMITSILSHKYSIQQPIMSQEVECLGISHFVHHIRIGTILSIYIYLYIDVWWNSQ